MQVTEDTIRIGKIDFATRPAEGESVEADRARRHRRSQALAAWLLATWRGELKEGAGNGPTS